MHAEQQQRHGQNPFFDDDEVAMPSFVCRAAHARRCSRLQNLTADPFAVPETTADPFGIDKADPFAPELTPLDPGWVDSDEEDEDEQDDDDDDDIPPQRRAQMNGGGGRRFLPGDAVMDDELDLDEDLAAAKEQFDLATSSVRAWTRPALRSLVMPARARIAAQQGVSKEAVESAFAVSGAAPSPQKKSALPPVNAAFFNQQPATTGLANPVRGKLLALRVAHNTRSSAMISARTPLGRRCASRSAAFAASPSHSRLRCRTLASGALRRPPRSPL